MSGTSSSRHSPARWSRPGAVHLRRHPAAELGRLRQVGERHLRPVRPGQRDGLPQARGRPAGGPCSPWNCAAVDRSRSGPAAAGRIAGFGGYSSMPGQPAPAVEVAPRHVHPLVPRLPPRSDLGQQPVPRHVEAGGGGRGASSARVVRPRAVGEVVADERAVAAEQPGVVDAVRLEERAVLAEERRPVLEHHRGRAEPVGVRAGAGAISSITGPLPTSDMLNSSGSGRPPFGRTASHAAGLQAHRRPRAADHQHERAAGVLGERAARSAAMRRPYSGSRSRGRAPSSATTAKALSAQQRRPRTTTIAARAVRGGARGRRPPGTGVGRRPGEAEQPGDAGGEGHGVGRGFAPAEIHGARASRASLSVNRSAPGPVRWWPSTVRSSGTHVRASNSRHAELGREPATTRVQLAQPGRVVPPQPLGRFRHQHQPGLPPGGPALVERVADGGRPRAGRPVAVEVVGVLARAPVRSKRRPSCGRTRGPAGGRSRRRPARGRR